MTSDRDWTERTLCDDGSCTGVIGGDGACRTCGRASRYWGDERRRGLKPPVEVDADEVEDVPSDQGPGAGDDDRELCVDGGCVGLIGANGKCKVCGLPGPTRRPARAKPAAKAAKAVTPAVPADDASAGDASARDADVGDDDGVDDVHADDGVDDDGDDDDDADDGDDDDDDADDGDHDADDGDDGDDRKLCPDGGCVGVLDANGICKICGRSDAEN